MILYVRKRMDGAIELSTEEGTTVRPGSFARCFDSFALQRLSTYAGARTSAMRILGVRRLVPLHLTEDVLLVPLAGLRSDDALFVNFRAIASVGHSDGTSGSVRFRDGSVLWVPSYGLLVRGVRLARRLEAFLTPSRR
jgi:hypothetical protein